MWQRSDRELQHSTVPKCHPLPAPLVAAMPEGHDLPVFLHASHPGSERGIWLCWHQRQGLTSPQRRVKGPGLDLLQLLTVPMDQCCFQAQLLQALWAPSRQSAVGELLGWVFSPIFLPEAEFPQCPSA